MTAKKNNELPTDVGEAKTDIVLENNDSQVPEEETSNVGACETEMVKETPSPGHEEFGEPPKTDLEAQDEDSEVPGNQEKNAPIPKTELGTIGEAATQVTEGVEIVGDNETDTGPHQEDVHPGREFSENNQVLETDSEVDEGISTGEIDSKEIAKADSEITEKTLNAMENSGEEGGTVKPKKKRDTLEVAKTKEEAVEEINPEKKKKKRVKKSETQETEIVVTEKTQEDVSTAKKVVKKQTLVSMGEYVSSTVITESGSYRLVVSDDADNSIEILFVIDKFVDIDINVNDKGLANDVTIVANEDVNYTLTMGDAAIDYEMGTTITNPGTYSLVVTDEIGNRTEMSFTVVKSLVSKFEHNFDDMQGFEKVLVNGEDKRLNYGTLELFADGEYEVGVVANGVTYTFNITVDGTKPTIKLNGVENGGKTENPVTITDLSEKGEVTVYLNNEKLLYELGNELTEDGKYRVVAKDECGNTTEYTFEIKANDSFKYIALATVAGIGVIGAVVFFILKKKKKF